MSRYSYANRLFLLQFKYSSMRNILVIICVLFLFISCDDGDIITVDLDFGDDLSRCENNQDSYLIYKVRTDPSESLAIIIPRTATNELLFTEATPEGTPTQLEDVRFIYRTYNRDIATGELCELVPAADLTIIEDYESSSGTIEVTATVEDDDGDGIPTAFELDTENADGDNDPYTNPLDTDGDGIPDYIDADDDNDNVPTRFELDTENADGDDNPATNPLDTDGDGIPNYLDPDDDNDMVDTIFEDENGENGPRDDTSENNGEFIPLYLNNLETVTYPFVEFNEENSYTRTVRTQFVIINFNLEIISGDTIQLGTFVNSFPLPDDN